MSILSWLRGAVRDDKVAENIFHSSEILANSAEHVRNEGAFDVAVDDVQGLLTRREAMFGLIGAFVAEQALEGAAQSVLAPAFDSSAQAIGQAIQGKAFDIPESVAMHMDRNRSREALSALLAQSVLHPQTYRYVDTFSRVVAGRGATDDDITFLEEICAGDCNSWVRHLANHTLSTELMRRGDVEACLARLKNFRKEWIPADKLLDHEIQQIAVEFNTIMSSNALVPDTWRMCRGIEAVCEAESSNLGFQFQGGKFVRVPDLKDEVVISETERLGGNFAHLTFFAFHAVTANPLLSQTDRRKLWDHQITLNQKIVDPNVLDIEKLQPRAAWNHFILLALQAHRLEDYEYRDKFVRIAVGSREFWPSSFDLNRHLVTRRSSFDDQYLYFCIFLETLKLHGQAPVDYDTGIEFLIERRGRFRSIVARQALDTFRKYRGDDVSVQDAVRDWCFAPVSHDAYVANI